MWAMVQEEELDHLFLLAVALIHFGPFLGSNYNTPACEISVSCVSISPTNSNSFSYIFLQQPCKVGPFYCPPVANWGLKEIKFTNSLLGRGMLCRLMILLLPGQQIQQQQQPVCLLYQVIICHGFIIINHLVFPFTNEVKSLGKISSGLQKFSPLFFLNARY